MIKITSKILLFPLFAFCMAFTSTWGSLQHSKVAQRTLRKQLKTYNDIADPSFPWKEIANDAQNKNAAKSTRAILLTKGIVFNTFYPTPTDLIEPQNTDELKETINTVENWNSPTDGLTNRETIRNELAEYNTGLRRLVAAKLDGIELSEEKDTFLKDCFNTIISENKKEKQYTEELSYFAMINHEHRSGDTVFKPGNTPQTIALLVAENAASDIGAITLMRCLKNRVILELNEGKEPEIKYAHQESSSTSNTKPKTSFFFPGLGLFASIFIAAYTHSSYAASILSSARISFLKKIAYAGAIGSLVYILYKYTTSKKQADLEKPRDFNPFYDQYIPPDTDKDNPIFAVFDNYIAALESIHHYDAVKARISSLPPMPSHELSAKASTDDDEDSDEKDVEEKD